jgi:hypothetical protein
MLRHEVVRVDEGLLVGCVQRDDTVYEKKG